MAPQFGWSVASLAKPELMSKECASGIIVVLLAQPGVQLLMS